MLDRQYFSSSKRLKRRNADPRGTADRAEDCKRSRNAEVTYEPKAFDRSSPSDESRWRSCGKADGAGMNKIDDLNAKNIRLAFASIAFVVFACWLYSLSDRFLLDPDTYWHIATGRDIWATNHLPTTDEKSHSFYGRPWIAKEWLSQIILYAAYYARGWALLVSVAVLSLSVTGSLLFFLLSARINATLALVIAFVSMFLSMQTYLVRPHVFTFPLCILWTEHLLRASENGRAPSFWLLAVLVAWANLHNSFTIAFLIAFLCAANFFERSRLSDLNTLRRWALFLLLCLAASLLHPYGYEPLLVSLDAVGNEWVTLKGQSEWRAVDVVSEPVHAAALISLLLAQLTFGIRLNLSKSVIVSILLFLFLSHIRFAYLFYYLTPLVVSFALRAQYPRLSESAWAGKLDDRISIYLSRYARLIVACAISLYLGIAGGFIAFSGVAPNDAITPAKALEAARTGSLTGNVLNSGEFGGFLVFSGVKTFLDGSNDQLFRGKFLRDALKSLEPDGAAIFTQQLREYNIGWTLLRPSDPRVRKLDADPNWKRFYEDGIAVIHVPAKPSG